MAAESTQTKLVLVHVPEQVADPAAGILAGAPARWDVHEVDTAKSDVPTVVKEALRDLPPFGTVLYVVDLATLDPYKVSASVQKA